METSCLVAEMSSADVLFCALPSQKKFKDLEHFLGMSHLRGTIISAIQFHKTWIKDVAS
jgi:hypothetical protein